MANREISQFASLAAGSQSSTMYLPIVDTSLGHVAGANLKVTLNSLFFDLGLNTADGATGMTGLLAAPSAAAAGKLKWYYNNSTKQWLASIDTGSYYSVQRSIAAGLTAGRLPYVDTGGILNASANATLDANGSLGCTFLNLTSSSPGLNTVAEINDSTATDRWEIRLGASNQLIFNDFVNNKDVITLTPGATPVVQLNGTLRWLTDNSQDIGLINSGRARTAYIGTSVIIGRSSNTTGVLTFNNSTNTNQTSFQAGAAAASRTYTWPTDFGAAGSVLTDAAGNGTLSWAVPSGTIGGSIAATQIAYGSGANTITGSANLVYDSGNIRVGIGVTPSYPLDLQVPVAASDQVVANFYNNSATAGSIVRIARSAANRAASVNLNDQWYAGILRNSGSATTVFAISSNSDIGAGGKEITAAIGGGVGIGAIATSTQQLLVTASSSTTIGQIIKLAAAQTADALEVLDSGSSVLTKITSAGVTVGNNGFGTWINNTASPNAFFGNTGNTVSHVIAVFRGMASQSGSLSQWQNSGGTVLTDINSGGMLTIGTASISLDRAIWVKGPAYDTSTSLYAFMANHTAPATATVGVLNFYSRALTAASAYTLASLYNFYADSPSLGAGSAITTSYGLYIAKQKQTGVTTGYGIYQADSADKNFFAGITQIAGDYVNSGALGIGVGAQPGYLLYAQATPTATSGNLEGIAVLVQNTPGSASSATTAGGDFSASYTGTQTVTGANVGGKFQGNISINSPGSIVTNRAGYFSAYLFGSGTITFHQGLYIDHTNQGTGTITNSYGWYVVSDVNSGGTVSNLFGGYIKVPGKSSGTLTSNCGLLIESFVNGTNNSHVVIGQTSIPAGNFSIYNASTYANYFAGILRLQLTSTVGVLSMGGASSSGAYFGVSTSSQAANDKLISVAMVGSITGTLYAADISMTATVNVLTRITNTENATATSNCELQLVTGGASGGDPFIHFNISGNTDWSIGADNSDSDNLVIAASSALGTSNALTITTAGLVTLAGSITITGKQKNLTVSTGAGSALLGANSPAATLTAPFEWINVTLSDGSTGYVPAWK